MFYLLVYARNNSKQLNTPIVLWIEGGPGVSSLAGAYLVNGPVRLDKDAKQYYNKFSWSNKANMIYLDAPLGAGFSSLKSNNSR